MDGLGAFIMRGRLQAILVASVLAALALVLPLFNILSSVVVALVTLRQGPRDGLWVGLVSALASGLAAGLVFGSPLLVVSLLLVLWAPVWVLSLVLRGSRSLDLAVQLGLIFGLMLIGLVYLEMGSPQAQWGEVLRPFAGGLVEAQILEAGQLEPFLVHMATWMTGALAAAFYFQVLVTLLLARAWQARLFNPGGFRQEFHALRMHRLVGLAGLLLVGALLLLGAAPPPWVRDLGALWIPLGLFQGLAVAHRVADLARWHRAWLVALYTLLVLAVPQAELLVALVGLADVFLDLRARVRPKPQPGP